MIHIRPQHILRHFFFMWLLLMAEAACFAQTQPRPNIQNVLLPYFLNYDLGFRPPIDRCTIEDVHSDDENKQLLIFVSESFGMQPFTKEKVDRIYNEVRELLGSNFSTYKLRIYSKNVLIDELVAGGTGDEQRTWQDIRHRGNAWVTPLDRPYPTDNGLKDRHLCVWASHGRFFSLRDQEWQWQRPNLYCTTEDLLSQTFVIPYLFPMLEYAGAVVYSPRERDWQRHEVIVDNDAPNQNGLYLEVNGQHVWDAAGTGFAHTKSVYLDGENPFLDGTARTAATQTRRSQASNIMWMPVIPEDGNYAVYVSYTTLPTSVSDATYTVRHGGVSTHFRVNQQMGGGTWVYLGTFFFQAGNSQENCVILTNQSNYRGHVTADAVRFGGGMGNIARGDSHTVSGLPRFLEAARYSVQWAGAPYEAYASKESTNDYAEDINARSAMENYLARGSDYVPGDSGLYVPMELSLAVHTDAGVTTDSTVIGSLGIYTSDFYEGKLPSGLSRLTSRDVCDQVLSQVCADMTALIGHWTRRQMFDRNYSETREPMPPSIILEMLSHQNFNDMRLAHDPTFKFLMARSIYKGILRYIHTMHDSSDITVQPLPIVAPAAQINSEAHQITLSWLAQEDPLEPSAMPTGFIVYHATDNGDFDNGTYVHKAAYTLDNAAPDVLHRFRITACNKGGQSMNSQEVCAYIHDENAVEILVVDAFDRLAGPQPIANDSAIGFDFQADPGVPMAKMPGYCGRQVCFSRNGFGREGPGALGFSTSELEGLIIAGNTMDWATRHARDIIRATEGCVNIASCTAKATERTVYDIRRFRLLDLIYGLNRYDGYSLRSSKVFSDGIVQMVSEHVRNGGSVFVSGAYIGADMTADASRLFTNSILKYNYSLSMPADSVMNINGQNITLDIYHALNEKSYCVPSVDCLIPVNGAFCPLVYAPKGQSAAIAYAGADYRCYALGFPFESITDEAKRTSLLRGIIQFLVP